MRRLLRPLWFLLALIFLFEAWIWERIASGIARLPPYATLLVFAVPGLILLPFKLAGLWLIGGGHVIAGAGVFLLAKTVGVALTAFLFETCKPKLMQLGWFVTFYESVLRAKAWAVRQTEPARRYLRRLRQRLVGEKGRMLALVGKLRRRSWRRAAGP